MSNKKLGNQFEAELCEILSDHCFWAHNLAQNSAGQPADVIAVKDGEAYLIDCKICSQGKFQYSRIEENQDLSMELWRDCGNGIGLFALKFDTAVYMVDRESLRNCSQLHPAMTPELAGTYGCTLEEWLWDRT
jgi:Holliday junction resolvase